MKIGDVLYYPLFGAGEIVDLNTKEFDGEDLLYCTFDVKLSKMKMQFPVKSKEVLHIREVTDLEKIRKAFTESKKDSYIYDSNWNRRYQRELQLLTEGTIEAVAGTIINFYYMQNERELSSGEKQLLKTAENLTISEIMFSENKDFDDAKLLFDSMLEEVLCKKNCTT